VPAEIAGTHAAAAIVGRWWQGLYRTIHLNSCKTSLFTYRQNYPHILPHIFDGQPHRRSDRPPLGAVIPTAVSDSAFGTAPGRPASRRN
jgi:hypothetical protein